MGESSDGHHISSPDPTGAGAEIALRASLSQAGITSHDIGYVNLHGTGTPKNDEMESNLIHRLFGTQTPASSTKALMGHTLGAAGAQEAGICWLVLSDYNTQKHLPPQYATSEYDPSLKPISLCEPGTPLIKNYCMSTSFAFGGSNASVIIGKV